MKHKKVEHQDQTVRVSSKQAIKVQLEMERVIKVKIKKNLLVYRWKIKCTCRMDKVGLLFKLSSHGSIPI